MLSYLDPIFEDDDGLRGQLTKQLDDICSNMNDFGKSGEDDKGSNLMTSIIIQEIFASMHQTSML